MLYFRRGSYPITDAGKRSLAKLFPRNGEPSYPFDEIARAGGWERTAKGKWRLEMLDDERAIVAREQSEQDAIVWWGWILTVFGKADGCQSFLNWYAVKAYRNWKSKQEFDDTFRHIYKLLEALYERQTGTAILNSDE